MARYIAFLRAINVGGHVVKMKNLRDLFQKLGFSNVETFIASGNVIFESGSTTVQDLEKKIEECLFKSLGYEVAAFIRTEAEITALARQKPFAEADLVCAPTLVAGFLKEPLTETSRRLLLNLASDIDSFGTSGREIFWLCRKRQSESEFSNAVFEKKLSVKSTFRGFPTIIKLAQRLKLLHEVSGAT